MITFVTSICSTHQDTHSRGTAIHSHLSQVSTQTVPMAKKAASFTRAMGEHVYRWNFLKGHTGRTIQLQKKETPIWFASLKPSHAEAFSWDSNIMKEARLCFFSNHSCDWATDGTNDLSDVFRELAESIGLLGEAIYEIQLSWTGPEELKQANYALWSLPKGLRFLMVVPTMESPKVMGLMGIHDPDALRHYAGYTYCPWCGKEGQNEGTVVNHLRTTHYRLGLVCDWCFGCPTVMSDSLHWHGCQNCQRYRVASGSGLSNWPTYPTRSLHKGAKAVLFHQTPFPPDGQKVQWRRCCLPACLIHLLFSTLTNKQLFLFQLWPGLPKKDATD